MILSNKNDAIHRAWLYRLLINIIDNKNLETLYFKGGTCAAMLGYLDRFSLDLDFDYLGEEKDIPQLRKELKTIFKDLDLEIKDKSKNVPQYFLRYPTKKEGERNTLKIDITFPPTKANVYVKKRLDDIDRIVRCQSIETMFANKLVALIDRFEKNGSIAGRDVYDIHHFFLNAYTYNEDVITERTGLSVKEYFIKLSDFINKKINATIIDQDLNTLLEYEKFKKIRKTIKEEVLLFVKNEIKKS